MDPPKQANEIVIPSMTPYFLERGPLWFKKEQQRIQDAIKNNDPFWSENILILREKERMLISEVLRKLDEMGYEKVQTISRPGEFSLQGGVLRISPLIGGVVATVDFLGNQIDSVRIHSLETEKESTKKDLSRRLSKESLRNLKPGDYLVHLDHGIGRFMGIEEHEPGTDTGYYQLEYALGDRLLVPLGLEKKLSRYIGFRTPKINRLGSPLWEKTKRKVRDDIIKTAKELLALYAKRELATRAPYLQDEQFQNEIEHTFPFQETSDQLSAIREVTNDLTKTHTPMDRIVCGDVGFGKTEVALRAAVTVASAGFQVAILAPTTILCDQHFHTFTKRLKNLPLTIRVLSRFQTKGEIQKILKELKEGTTDIVIGTHRLLSRDIAFGRLGLLIIDEEQKFGVRQKERFKETRAEIDVLSLSATPIPRTLYLSLSHLREISLIQTPPPDRLPIKTQIVPWAKDTIQYAVSKEIARKGQVYYLHNRVETIETAKHEIQQLLPHAKIQVAHGKMPERALLGVMDDMRKKKIDILIATTIIENGLDLANVNTLLVADATRLGLSQAYQIRGRIGRSHIQAYAYFLYPANKKMDEKASARLSALKEAEALGAGYQIAIRDLEIRGAGNILGKEQSGSINKVGLNLYCDMLAQTTENLKSNNDRAKNPNAKSD